jgi:hypothetical protein
MTRQNKNQLGVIEFFRFTSLVAWHYFIPSLAEQKLTLDDEPIFTIFAGQMHGNIVSKLKGQRKPHIEYE